MSPLPAEVRVLERAQVSPPAGAVAESTLPLTYLDLLWVNGGSVERVFFYPLPRSTSYFLDSVVPNLKSSLSLVLQQFYPLAGKIRRSPEHAGEREGYEIHYADGDFVAFTVAELDGGDFGEVSGSHARELSRIIPLLPPLPKAEDGATRPLALQVTWFPKQGMAIGVTVHHAACDGTSSMLFMSSWAAACARAGGIAATATATAALPTPVLDRSLVADPQDLYKLFYEALGASGEVFEKMMNRAAPTDAVIRSFALGADHIRRLKEMISSKIKFHCSTIVATFAFVWTCFVKAQAHEKDKVVLMGFAAECRGRLRPPLPASYFGNCLSGCAADLTAGELTGEGGVVAAARVIGEAIEAFKKNPFEGVDQWPEKYKSMGTSKPLSVAGSPRFRVYDVDFGWGRPKKVEIPSIAKTGAMSVAESREEQGGVEIGFALPKHEMDEFEKHFSNDLKLLQ